ncbi:hypothetical protein NIES267_35870 [Calothrix parasitica NIES-267]|uniref:Uncharacterized protein n=1 Tax=Calothrix parasitica NIES-267 TaxID=1973488 RepID=A0A1Z4LSF1_9CYAN|nr:hypothetical protein NIES267_35870 [Calothrix parasitica NIES-267]
MNKKLITRIAAGFVTAYVSSYAAIRLTTNSIVHGVGTSSCTYYYHTVEPGDSGIIGLLINGQLALLFTPLRWLEVQYWYLVQPVGSPLSEKHQKQNKYASCPNET